MFRFGKKKFIQPKAEKKKNKALDEKAISSIVFFHEDPRDLRMELRNDQKWCSTHVSKDGGKDKRKHVVDVDREDEVGEPEARPMGVKAAKAAGKRKKNGKEEEMSQLQAILEKKDKLQKQKILDRLLAKKDPLSEMESSLKLKLMAEMLG